MSETPNATATQDETSNGTVPQAETATTSESSATLETTETTTPSQPSIDDLQERIKRMEAALKKANSEAKANRLEAEDLKKFKEQTEAEKLSETEKRDLARQKLEKQLSDLQSQHDNAVRQAQERIVNYEVRLKAAQSGIVDPDAAAKLLDWSEIEYDDNGQPTNVDKLLKDLLKAKPYLAARSAPTSGGATNPPRSQTSEVPLTREYIHSLTAKDYEGMPVEQRAKISQWLRDNPYKRH